MMTREKRRSLAHAALAVGVVAAVFVIILCALLAVTHYQTKKADPLNNKALVELRDRYAAGDQSDAMKRDIRTLDLLARRAYFVSQDEILLGSVIAVLGGVVMLAAFGVYKWASRSLPLPDDDDCEGIFWIGLERSRIWVAGGTVLLVAVSVVLAMSTKTPLTPAAAPPPAGDPEPQANRKPAPVKPVKPNAKRQTADLPVLPPGFDEQAPTFRGPRSNGLTNFDGVPVQWDESKKQNVLWKTPLDLPAWAAPVVWEDKVVVLGANADKRFVYCLQADTGARLWTREIPALAAANNSYKPDTMDEHWDRLVYAGGAPATNGKQVFVQFSNGQLAALDLADGKILWNIVAGNTEGNKYGWDNSLLIYKDAVISVFEGKNRSIACYRAETGAEIWKSGRQAATWASPILARRPNGEFLVVLTTFPDVVAWDLGNGIEAWRTKVFPTEPDYCFGPTAVQVGDRVYVNGENSGMYGIELADGRIAWKLEELPDFSGFQDGASMATDGKHVYQFHNSILTCVDTATGKVVKQKEFAEVENYASPIINQGRLYLFCEDGEVGNRYLVTVVVRADPATDFAKLGRGVVNETVDAVPAVVKGRLYLRSDKSVYCLGTKAND